MDRGSHGSGGLLGVHTLAFDTCSDPRFSDDKETSGTLEGNGDTLGLTAAPVGGEHVHDGLKGQTECPYARHAAETVGRVEAPLRRGRMADDGPGRPTQWRWRTGSPSLTGVGLVSGPEPGAPPTEPDDLNFMYPSRIPK